MLKATDCSYRFLVLFFNCMLTFGSYFCFDMPSVLQTMFQSPDCKNSSSITLTSSNGSHDNTSCCDGCLGMSGDEYNLLYAVYAWTDAVVVIGAGFLIDKLGNIIGLIGFSFLATFGAVLFALGSLFPGTKAIFPLMLIGRLIFGAGNGSLTIVQNRITAFWFKDKELAMAFGITLAFSRLGSVLNFLLTENFAQHHGLRWTLWGGTVLCGLGFVSAFIVSVLDRKGVKELGVHDSMLEESKQLKFTDIRHFSLEYWLLCFTLMFFYNGVFPFVADSSKFIHDKYDFSPVTASYISGAVYVVSMVLSPFLGRLIDIVGKRGVLALLCGLLTVPVYGLLAFTTVHPLVSTLWLGVTYSFAAASLWPSIPLVVSEYAVGTAMGVATSIQMVGIGLCNLVVGVILGHEHDEADEHTEEEMLLKWKYVMVFLLCNVIACVACAALLNLVDTKRDKVLNESKAQRLARLSRPVIEARISVILPSSSEDENDSFEPDTDPLLSALNDPIVN